MNNKGKIIAMALALTSVCAATSFSFAQVVEDADDVTFSFGAANTHRVTFYTSFDSSWEHIDPISYTDGSTITLAKIPTFSIPGYTLQGWIQSAPTSENYSTGVITSANLANQQVTSDLTYYPILKSNNELVYTNGTYYPYNEDVVINADEITETVAGDAYIGIDGIPSPTADWIGKRQLTTSSGIYQFKKEDPDETGEYGAYLYRKLGFSTEEDKSGIWTAANYNDRPRKVWSQIGASGEGGNEYEYTQIGTSERFYTYVAYQYTRFYIKNFSYYKDSEKQIPYESGAINLTDGDGYTSTNWMLHKTTDWWEGWTIPGNAEWGA